MVVDGLAHRGPQASRSLLLSGARISAVLVLTMAPVFSPHGSHGHLRAKSTDLCKVGKAKSPSAHGYVLFFKGLQGTPTHCEFFFWTSFKATRKRVSSRKKTHPHQKTSPNVRAVSSGFHDVGLLEPRLADAGASIFAVPSAARPTARRPCP